jgi:hypothetical protein
MTDAQARDKAHDTGETIIGQLFGQFAGTHPLFRWMDAGGQHRYDRVSRLVTMALFRLYRKQTKGLAPAIVGFTTAPADYDFEYTETLESFDLPDDYNASKIHHWRKVAIYDPSRIDYQKQRYSSGLHGFSPEDPRVYAAELVEKKKRWKQETDDKAAAAKTLEDYVEAGKRRDRLKEDKGFARDRARLEALLEGKQHVRIEWDNVPSGARMWPAVDAQRVGVYLLDVKLPTTRHYTPVIWTKWVKDYPQLGHVSFENFEQALSWHGKKGVRMLVPIDLDVPLLVAYAANRVLESWGTVVALVADDQPVWELRPRWGDSTFVREDGRTIPKSSKLFEIVKGAAYAKRWGPRTTPVADTPPAGKRSSSGISSIDPATMTAGKINAELDRLDALSSTVTQEFIATGRGHERPSDWEHKTDPLSLRSRAVSDRYRELRSEIEYRAGPKYTRMPTGRGFGPRK